MYLHLVSEKGISRLESLGDCMGDSCYGKEWCVWGGIWQEWIKVFWSFMHYVYTCILSAFCGEGTLLSRLFWFILQSILSSQVLSPKAEDFSSQIMVHTCLTSSNLTIDLCLMSCSTQDPLSSACSILLTLQKGSMLPRAFGSGSLYPWSLCWPRPPSRSYAFPSHPSLKAFSMVPWCRGWVRWVFGFLTLHGCLPIFCAESLSEAWNVVYPIVPLPLNNAF